MTNRILESNRKKKKMRYGFWVTFGFIVVFGSISAVLTKYWDTLPKPPQSHEIQFTGEKSMDFDHWSAVLMRADFDRMKSQDKIPIAHMRFYASDVNPNEVAAFYSKAMDTPWSVAGDKNEKRRHVIIYRKMITGEMKIIAIEQRLVRDAENHVVVGSGSIIGTAEVNN